MSLRRSELSCLAHGGRRLVRLVLRVRARPGALRIVLLELDHGGVGEVDLRSCRTRAFRGSRRALGRCLWRLLAV
eukprot:8345812-Heterocapsa_arctica.AAC.1